MKTNSFFTILLFLISFNSNSLFSQSKSESISYDKLLEKIDLFEKNSDTIYMIKSYKSIALKYYEEYKDEEALEYFMKAYQLSMKYDDIELKRLTTLNMAIVEENRKRYKEALSFRKQYEIYNDSISAKNIESLKSKNLEALIVDKNNNESMKSTSSKSSFDKNILWSVSLFFFVATTVYFYSKSKKINKN